MPDFAIQIHELTRDFGDVRAVDHLTLDVPAGTIFGYLGPNGSGKTTTIRLLLGLLEPTSGKAEVLGFDTRARDQAVRERTGQDGRGAPAKKRKPAPKKPAAKKPAAKKAPANKSGAKRAAAKR